MPAPLRAQREGAQAGASASGGGSSKAANADLRRCSAADLANVAATLPAEPFGDVLLAHGAELVAHAVCVGARGGTNLFKKDRLAHSRTNDENTILFCLLTKIAVAFRHEKKGREKAKAGSQDGGRALPRAPCAAGCGLMCGDFSRCPLLCLGYKLVVVSAHHRQASCMLAPRGSRAGRTLACTPPRCTSLPSSANADGGGLSRAERLLHV